MVSQQGWGLFSENSVKGLSEFRKISYNEFVKFLNITT